MNQIWIFCVLIFRPVNVNFNSWPDSIMSPPINSKAPCFRPPETTSQWHLNVKVLITFHFYFVIGNGKKVITFSRYNEDIAMIYIL